MDDWFISRTAAWTVVLLHLITDVVGVECYACAYVPGARSEGACSEPWTWTRSRFNLFTGPPKRVCEEACVKTVIDKPGQWSAVLRTCGSPCNETRVGSTLTTCCTTDLCNAAPARRHAPTQRRLVYTLLLLVLAFYSLDVR